MRLAVILYGEQIGVITQHRRQVVLEYIPGTAGGTPLSLSLPRTQSLHRGEAVTQVLDALLPDDDEVRRDMGRQFGVSPDDPFALLTHAGMDCAGGAQFVPEDDLPEALSRGGLEPLSTGDIEMRLADLSDDYGASWMMERETWSLPGYQPKFALRQEGDSWFQASGAQATTHIFKPGIRGLKLSALNEHVCLSAAGALGFRVAHSEYCDFKSQSAIVSTRYDRKRGADGEVIRVHQEDMCQATGTDPRKKYPSQGAPTAAQIARLLRDSGAQADVLAFRDALIFNYLIGATDAHARNYSVLLAAGQARLAPLYDVASALPYDRSTRPLDREMAMDIGGTRRIGDVTVASWRALARDLEVDERDTWRRLLELAEQVPDAISGAFTRELRAGLGHALAERLIDRVADHCASVRQGDPRRG